MALVNLDSGKTHALESLLIKHDYKTERNLARLVKLTVVWTPIINLYTIEGTLYDS